MYIIEKIIKLYLKCTNKEVIIPTPNDDSNVELEDVITCKHTFMPIDSTGKILACSKCGYVVNRNRISKKKSKSLK